MIIFVSFFILLRCVSFSYMILFLQSTAACVHYLHRANTISGMASTATAFPPTPCRSDRKINIVRISQEMKIHSFIRSICLFFLTCSVAIVWFFPLAARYYGLTRSMEQMPVLFVGFSFSLCVHSVQ